MGANPLTGVLFHWLGGAASASDATCRQVWAGIAVLIGPTIIIGIGNMVAA